MSPPTCVPSFWDFGKINHSMHQLYGVKNASRTVVVMAKVCIVLVSSQRPSLQLAYHFIVGVFWLPLALRISKAQTSWATTPVHRLGGVALRMIGFKNGHRDIKNNKFP